jgi:membrane-associated phospholipid phosphatase
MKNFAKIVSRIFGPFTSSPVLLAVLFTVVSPSWLTGVLQFLFFFLVIYLIPSIYLIEQLKRKQADIELSAKEQRPTFFLLLTICLWLAWALAFYIFKMDEKIIAYFLAAGLLMTVFTSISYFWKISIHTAYATALTLFMVWLFGPWFWFLALLVPLVAWSRYVLRLHTIPQMVAGVIISAAIIFLTAYIVSMK